MGTSDKKIKLVRVRLPVELCRAEIKNAVGVGLFYLAMGRMPDTIPSNSATTNTRIRLSEKAQWYLKQIIGDFGSQNAALTAAMAFVAEKPNHVRNTII